MLIKTYFEKENKFLHPILQNYLFNKNFKGNISLDYKNRIRIDNNIIPFEICKKIIFKYNCTFQQNNSSISNKIRNYVLENITDFNYILSIGGESYIYPIINKKNYTYFSN